MVQLVQLHINVAENDFATGLRQHRAGVTLSAWLTCSSQGRRLQAILVCDLFHHPNHGAVQREGITPCHIILQLS